MKKYLTILALASFALGAHAQVVLQNFGSVIDPNTYFYGTWEQSTDLNGTVLPNAGFSQGSGTYTIDSSTATNSDTSKIEFFYAPSAAIGSNGFLAVTAQLTAANAAPSFQIILVDTSAVTAFASFNSSSFNTGSMTTVYSAITPSGGFNANSIDSMIISGGLPGGVARFGVIFDQVAATATASPVPEPSTYAALLGLAALGVILYRRRSVATA